MTGVRMRGDAEFAAFARARGDRMLRVAWLITRHHEDARDAVQDALLGLHRSRARLPEGDALEAYVHRSVVNAALRVVGRRSPALPPADGVRPLVGTTWVTEDAKPLAQRPWIRFNPDGMLEGHDGCNGFSGAYRVDGEAFSVGQLVATASGCAPHPNPGFMDALTSVTKHFTGVSHLSLTRADGMTVLGFRPLHPTTEEATDGVRLRLVNNTGRDIEAITLAAPDLQVEHGPLAAGATSEELAPDGALYRYARVDITWADGSTDLLMPTDFAGEQPVGPGRFSYVLSIVHGPDWINGRSLMIGLEESGRPSGVR